MVNEEEIEDLLDGDSTTEGGDELYEHLRLVVDKGQIMLRIDKFLMTRVAYATRTRLQKACEAGSIMVNEKTVKSNYKIKPGDVITAVFAYPPRTTELIAEDIPINIVYQDDNVAIINKEPGMVVHPGYGNYTGTLVNALLFHFNNLPSLKQNVEADLIRPGLVHRIDKNTSGILVLAKDEFSLSHLAKQFFDHTTERIYYALVWGNFDENEGTITGHVGRSLKNRKMMTVFPEGDYGKHAVTHYKVLERFGYVTLVQCQLETGRTHQIRVHFKHIGHPLFNDDLYGGNRLLKGTTFTRYRQFIDNCFKIIPRHSLHAKSLGFVHPITKEKMLFDSELPKDFSDVLEKWRSYAHNKKLYED